ncbi:MAG: RNA polymerase sigma factor region1.1 domain-containing protein, partial [Azonexus sp.]|nr:RNA polymerase sigma factor region1.1 domain-containing protein [Azonexus sp.]
MAKAKDPAKEAPKVRISKAKEKAAEKALLQGAMAETPEPLDAEARKMRLKALIKLGKERGYLTYAEINDHLPDDVVDAESIEAIISTFNDMSIKVFDEAPAAEDLLMSDTAAAATDDEEAEEQAEQALSSVDSEFGRTTDPVRMYMREMGTVELLTREGEIEIAKRIEEGLKHMVQAISACPTTITDILELVAKVEADEMRIDELVDGLIDPNAVVEPPAAEPAEQEEADDEEVDDSDEDEGEKAAGAASASLLQLKVDALERFNIVKALHAKMQKILPGKGPHDKAYIKLQEQLSDELMNVRFTSRSIEKLCDSVRGMVEQIRRSERKIQQLCVDRVKMPRPHFIQSFPSNEVNLDWVDAEIAAAPKTYVAILTRSAPDIKE